ncbi:SOS response-associated peptidase [Undibacterium sp.]|uniref:SOS response-associated peptidase n=1 Tax=Undibacterium sp. TaxID=1914977 RepID=UPI0037512B80
MCVNYTPTRKDQITAKFNAVDQTGEEWRPETWQDYAAPFITHDDLKRRRAQLGSYSMIPKTKIAPGVKRFSTMNARAETLGELRSYAKPWREGKLCLIPLQDFFEPNYESGKAERWQIGLHDRSDFAVAGLYRSWNEPDGQQSFSFTQITINADDHPLMQRFHKPGDEKRSLVILPEQDYDEWLSCCNPEMARAFLQLYPAEKMWAKPAEATQRKTKKPPTDLTTQVSLFGDE